MSERPTIGDYLCRGLIVSLLLVGGYVAFICLYILLSLV